MWGGKREDTFTRGAKKLLEIKGIESLISSLLRFNIVRTSLTSWTEVFPVEVIDQERRPGFFRPGRKSL